MQNKVVGFGFAYKYHHASVFNNTIKFSYFIDQEHTHKGIGLKLLHKLEQDCIEQGIENILVHISSLNEASLNFHKKYGFVECGKFQNIGKKYERYFDEIWMQKKLIQNF